MTPRRAALIRAGIHWAWYDLNGPVSDTEPQHPTTRAAYHHTLHNTPGRDRQDINNIRTYRRLNWRRA